MTYEPKTKAGEWVLSMGMLARAKSPYGGVVDWEALVQDMEEDAARLERERLLKEVQMLPIGYTGPTKVDVIPRSVIIDLLAEPDRPDREQPPSTMVNPERPDR